MLKKYQTIDTAVKFHEYPFIIGHGRANFNGKYPYSYIDGYRMLEVLQASCT
jgi:hypothetical protein